jgi:amidase
MLRAQAIIPIFCKRTLLSTNREHLSPTKMSSPPKPKKQKKLRPWQEIAAEAQKHRDATIALVQPPLPPLPVPLPKNVTSIPATILTPEELQITESLPETLLRELAAGRLTAVGVTRAFLRRAGVAQGLV